VSGFITIGSEVVAWMERSEIRGRRRGFRGRSRISLRSIRATKQTNKGSGTPRNGCVSLRASGRGSALKAGARSPLGVPPRFSSGDCHPLTQLQARHPGTWRERMILWTANRGEDRTRLRGRYPRPPIPVQGAPPAPAIVPASMMPEAARVRQRRTAARRHRTRSTNRCHLAGVL
jgi:hypothetical protein